MGRRAGDARGEADSQRKGEGSGLGQLCAWHLMDTPSAKCLVDNLLEQQRPCLGACCPDGFFGGVPWAAFDATTTSSCTNCKPVPLAKPPGVQFFPSPTPKPRPLAAARSATGQMLSLLRVPCPIPRPASSNHAACLLAAAHNRVPGHPPGLREGLHYTAPCPIPCSPSPCPAAARTCAPCAALGVAKPRLLTLRVV